MMKQGEGDEAKATHYKVICISIYTGDLQCLDERVQAPRAKGLHKAASSALIRHAFDLVDLENVPRGL